MTPEVVVPGEGRLLGWNTGAAGRKASHPPPPPGRCPLPPLFFFFSIPRLLLLPETLTYFFVSILLLYLFFSGWGSGEIVLPPSLRTVCPGLQQLSTANFDKFC